MLTQISTIPDGIYAFAYSDWRGNYPLVLEVHGGNLTSYTDVSGTYDLTIPELWAYNLADEMRVALELRLSNRRRPVAYRPHPQIADLLQAVGA